MSHRTIRKLMRPEEFLLLVLVIVIYSACYFPGVTCPSTKGFFGFLFAETSSTFVILLVPYAIINWMIIPTFKKVERPTVRTKKLFKGLLGFFRSYLPFIIVFVLYTHFTRSFETGDLTHYVNPRDYTYLLSRIDNAILGTQFSHWSQRITAPLLTELMFVFYSLHFIYPLALGTIIYLKGNPKDFRNFILAIVLVCFIGYIGYFLFPAISPIYFLDYEYDLTGKVITNKMNQLLSKIRGAERDCCVFPSLHVGIATVVLLSSKKEKVLFYVLLPFITLSWFSTLYLRRHWFIDIVFGLIIGLIAMYLSPKVNKKWYKKSR